MVVASRTLVKMRWWQAAAGGGRGKGGGGKRRPCGCIEGTHNRFCALLWKGVSQRQRVSCSKFLLPANVWLDFLLQKLKQAVLCGHEVGLLG